MPHLKISQLASAASAAGAQFAPIVSAAANKRITLPTLMRGVRAEATAYTSVGSHTFTTSPNLIYFEAVVVGGGGGGGQAAQSSASNGANGTRSFFANVTAGGGQGGTAPGGAAIPVGGSAAGGFLNLTGGGGGLPTNANALCGTFGGVNPLGGAGSQGPTTASGGTDHALYAASPNTGAGGGGGGGWGAVAQGAGGGAAGGYAVQFFASAGAYSLAVGSGGNGGNFATVPTSSNPGGNGANGVVIIRQFFTAP